MNKILIFAILTFGFLKSYSQIIYTPQTAAGYQYKYAKVDSGLAIPFIDTSLRRGVNRIGAIVARPQDSLLYYWTGSKWAKVSQDVSSLIALINTKVDSVTVLGDELRYWVNGTPTMYSLSTIAGTLNSVTTNGNTTANTINVGKVISGSDITVVQPTFSDVLAQLVTYFGPAKGVPNRSYLRGDSITTDNSYFLPDTSGVFVTSVNGVLPNKKGQVSIPTTGSTDSSIYSTNFRLDTTRARINADINSTNAQVTANTAAIAQRQQYTDTTTYDATKYDLNVGLATKQNTLTLTTTGTSGAATLISDVLNIPQYSSTALDTTTIYNNLALKLNISDTAAMLNDYVNDAGNGLQKLSNKRLGLGGNLNQPTTINRNNTGDFFKILGTTAGESGGLAIQNQQVIIGDLRPSGATGAIFRVNGNTTDIDNLASNATFGINTGGANTASLDVNGSIRFRNGAGLNKIWISDATGIGSWQTKNWLEATDITAISPILWDDGTREISADTSTATYALVPNYRLDTTRTRINSNINATNAQVTVNTTAITQRVTYANLTDSLNQISLSKNGTNDSTVLQVNGRRFASVDNGSIANGIDSVLAVGQLLTNNREVNLNDNEFKIKGGAGNYVGLRFTGDGKSILGDIEALNTRATLTVDGFENIASFSNMYNTTRFGVNGFSGLNTTLEVNGSIGSNSSVRFTGLIQNSLDTTNNKILVIANDGTLKKSHWQSGGGLSYPYITNKYLNGYGDFPALNTDSITQGATNKFSQWTTSGSDIYYNAGKVGVGTTSPSANFHSAGASLFRSGSGTFTQSDIDVPGTSYGSGNGFSLIAIGSGYSGPGGAFTNASAVLIANSGSNMSNGMAIGAAHPTGTLRMYTGGNNERMRIAANGDVSIAGLTTNGYVKASGGTGLLISSASIPQSDVTNLTTDLAAKQAAFSQVVATDANITAANFSVYVIPASTLTANRNFDVSAISTDLNAVEIYNYEPTFTYTFTGGTVYLLDGVTTVTTITNPLTIIKRINGKLTVIN